MIAAATDRIWEVMAVLDGQRPHSFGLIHADLIAKNLLWQQEDAAKSALTALDFDDCAFGYYLYDLAPLLLYSKHEPDYPERRNALWNGYISNIDAVSVDFDTMEALVAARHIASIRWIAGNLGNPAIRDRAPEIIMARVDTLKRFVTTGQL